jgi:hypothetical protein
MRGFHETLETKPSSLVTLLGSAEPYSPTSWYGLMDSNGVLHLDAILYVQAELQNYTILQFLGEPVPVVLFYFNFNSHRSAQCRSDNARRKFYILQ